MKKLMIAAVLAAFAGAASADCADPKPCENCLWGYKIQLVAKTTIAGSVSNVYAKACGCYRKPTMGKVVGYIFGKTLEGVGTCGDAACGCNDWWISGANNVEQAPVVLLWKAWNKKALPVTSLTVSRMNRIGYKDRSTVEAVMDLTLTDEPALAANAPVLTLAGFGKAAHMANGNVAVKNLSGFFAGQMLAYCVDAGETVCGDPLNPTYTPAAYWTLCESIDPVNVPDEVTTDPLTAAYGKWQMVWDPQLVARFTKNGVNANTARPSAAYDLQDFQWDHQ